MRSMARERKAGQGGQGCLARVHGLRKDACLLVGTGMETASTIERKTPLHIFNPSLGDKGQVHLSLKTKTFLFSGHHAYIRMFGPSST